jgi:hypothetical protein
MSDEIDIPDLIDVSVTKSKPKSGNKETNQAQNDNEDFKLIVSKRKRREQNKMDSSASATTSAEATEEMEDEYEDVEDEEAELEKIDKSQDNQFQIKKLKFPPISSEKLMVIVLTF